MFGSAILETMIGIVFVFLVMSTVVSSLTEQLSTNVGLRARVLRLLIERLFGGKGKSLPKPANPFAGFKRWFSGVTRRLMFGLEKPRHYPDFEKNHLIKSLKKADGSFPAFIPPETLAEVVIDLLIGERADRAHIGTDTVITAEQEMAFLRESFAEIADGTVKPPECFSRETVRNLRLMFQRAQASVPDGSADVSEKRRDTFVREIGNWFDRACDRSSGWYKKAINRANVILAIILVAAINIDSLALINAIYTQPATRQNLNDAATEMAVADRAAEDMEGLDADGLREQIEQVRTEIDQLGDSGLPLGWTQKTLHPKPLSGWLSMILGWLISVFAISLGAPFWFDLLNKLVNLRNAGKEKSNQTDTREKKENVSGKDAKPAAPATLPATSDTERQIEKKEAKLPDGFWFQPARKDDFDKLAEPRDQHPEYQILTLAQASALAYRDEKTIRAVLEKAWTGMEEFVFLDSGQSTQGFFARKSNDLLVSFRGTEKKLEDFVADAKFRMEPFADGWGETHRGFDEALAEIYEPLITAVEKIKQEQENLRIFLTGHSLGAALATLCAAKFAIEGLTDQIQMLATFGSPRCGNEAFKNTFEKALGDKSHRVINHEDIVTRVPARVMGYCHVGKPYYIDGNGAVGDLVGWTRFLNTVLNAAADYKAAGQESVADHAIAGYITRWQNWTRNA